MSELLVPVAEAAQQRLEARDDDDRDQLADARAEQVSAVTPFVRLPPILAIPWPVWPQRAGTGGSIPE